MSIKNSLRSMIIKCLPDTISEDIINFKILDDCGYSSDVAIVASKILKKDTLSLAKRIENIIDKKVFSDIIIRDNGMLIFYLNREYLNNCIKSIISDGKNYGKSNYGNRKKICIECVIDQFSDDNINRIICLDCLSNIMNYAGFDVTTVCYIGDNAEIKSKLSDIRVYFDSFVSNDNLSYKGILDDALSILKRSNCCFIKNGGLWIRTEGHKDECLTNHDGDYMNFLYLVAYYISLFNNNYDGIIDIYTGVDEFNSIESILQINNFDLSKLHVKKFNNNYKADNELINDIRYKVVSGSDKINFIEKINSMISHILRDRNTNSYKSNSTKRDEYAYIIMNKLLEFEDIIIWCATRGEINRLCDYLEKLVYLFNNYNSMLESYNEEDNLIAESVYIVINNIASLLGLILRDDL